MAYYNRFIHLIAKFYPSLTWQKQLPEKTIYLTFDDGPVPEVTDFVLQVLNDYQIKATFFCVGENIVKNPDLFFKIIQNKHAIGNHTYNHLNGWKTKDLDYLLNIEKCRKVMNEALSTLNQDLTHKKTLFRPPYGKITRSQIKAIQTQYDIIMWNVLSGDYDLGQKPEACLQEAISNTKSGSIVIFHDSVKAEKNLEFALPLYIEHFISKGFQFNCL